MYRKRVGILIFPAVEVLDFCGPLEVFSVARVDEERRREEPSPFEVLVIAETAAMVRASGGLRVVPDCAIDDCPLLDILVVPGGWGARTEMGNPQLPRWLARQGRQVEMLCSVYTGALLLGEAGLLDGRRATTHFRSLDALRDLFPKVAVVADENIVEDGSVLSSAGIAAGIDLALRVVERYFGARAARATARHM